MSEVIEVPKIINKYSTKKKKVYSITSTLPKYKLSIIMIAILSFFALSIQPIANYVILVNLSDEIKANVLLLSKIY